MDSFIKSQQEMREKLAEAFGGKFGFKDFESLTRQNIEMFERTMRMFSPFGAAMGKDMPNPFAAFSGATKPSAKGNGAPEPPAPSQRDEEIRELKDQIAAMRQQIADLAQRK